ncbi:Beta-glucosidase 22 [Bienertia sinuspersici]
MVETGLDAYRFSISWSRLIPDGRGSINPKGLRYYNNLINELITHGIEPHVTLSHTDIPQILEDEDDFTAYVDVCFREFGDRVRYWTTFNEANIFVFGGYDVGITPPSRCSSPFGLNCTKGNSTIEPYVVAHHLLLAHGSVAKLYKEKYQTNQEMFMHPLTYGDYPQIMKKTAGSRIPVFTKNQSNMLKGSYDFIGVNYYSIMITKDNSNILSKEPRDFYGDMAVQWIYLNSSAPPPSEQDIFPSDQAWGIERVLENGSNTKGYFIWSLLDVYELLYSFNYTFGLYYVDYNDPNLGRHPKLSQEWYSAFLKGQNVTIDVENYQIENKRIIDFRRFSSSMEDDDILRRHPKLLHHMSS